MRIFSKARKIVKEQRYMLQEQRLGRHNYLGKKRPNHTCDGRIAEGNKDG